MCLHYGINSNLIPRKFDELHQHHLRFHGGLTSKVLLVETSYRDLALESVKPMEDQINLASIVDFQGAASETDGLG